MKILLSAQTVFLSFAAFSAELAEELRPAPAVRLFTGWIPGKE